MRMDVRLPAITKAIMSAAIATIIVIHVLQLGRYTSDTLESKMAGVDSVEKERAVTF